MNCKNFFRQFITFLQAEISILYISKQKRGFIMHQPLFHIDVISDNADLYQSSLKVIRVLENAGYQAWIVGGFIRNALMGLPAHDADIASAAPWKVSQQLFEEAGFTTHETGTEHGTLTVIVDGYPFEVTTFRHDGTYKDARHPECVEFVQSIEQDLARRDFTMNALAYHPDRGVLDLFGGVDDIKTGVIRAVGDPHKRFAEDALRILRGCRFASELGFVIEDATYNGMIANKGLLSRIAVERIRIELDRLLMGKDAGTALMLYVDVLSVVLPELVAMKGFNQQTPYHCYDVLEHTAHAVDGVAFDLLARWTMLCHDMGKPAAFFVDEKGIGHFYGHAAISVNIARGILERLKVSPTFADQVCLLVKRHDDVIEPNPRAVKRMLTKLGGDTQLFRTLCEVKRGDTSAQAQPYRAARRETIDALEQTLDEILTKDEAFSLSKLAINGNDVVALGVRQGPFVGQALQAALNAVIDEAIPNEPEALSKYVSAWWHACDKTK